jgi:hypothetical protein
MISTAPLQNNLEAQTVFLPPSASVAHSLLVARDRFTVELMRAAMGRLAISTEVCDDPAEAGRLLQAKKFDAVVVDFDFGDEAPAILGEMRLSPCNRTAPAIAVTRNQFELALAYCASANLVLQKPVTPQSLNRVLNVGYGLVMRERRRYFRCRIKAPVLIRRVGMRETRCRALNISEGGLEIASVPLQLGVGMRVYVQLNLPYRFLRLNATCETRWRNAHGHAGLQFLLMPLEQRCDLQEWLAARLEENLPESVVERFRSANQEFCFKGIRSLPPSEGHEL